MRVSDDNAGVHVALPRLLGGAALLELTASANLRGGEAAVGEATVDGDVVANLSDTTEGLRLTPTGRYS